MKTILDSLENMPVKIFEPGEVIIEEDRPGGSVFVLVEGTVLISREGLTICDVSESGAIFGEVASILGIHSSATVKVIERSSFHVIDNPKQFALENPDAIFHVAEQLAKRLVAIDKHFIDSKIAFEDLTRQMNQENPVPNIKKDDEMFGLWMKTQDGLVRHWHAPPPTDS